MHIEKNNSTLIIPNDTFWIKHTLSWLASITNQLELNEVESQKLQMAAEEAILNSIKHAYQEDEVGEIEITCAINTLGIQVSIKDQGIPYDPSLVDFDEATLKGFGSYILNKLVDKVVHNNLGTKGKQVVLDKYIDYINPDAIIKNIEDAKQEKSKEVISKDVSFLYELAQPQDAIEISKCAYEAYGYTYAYEHIYYPDRIRKLQRSEDLISILCKTSEGEIAGHIGITKSDIGENICEVGILMTKQKFRGNGLANKLVEQALKEAENRKITTLFAQCVSAHLYSQLCFVKFDFKPSALLPAYIPEQISFKKIDENSEKQRSGILLTCKLLENSKSKHIFHLPESCRDFGSKILDIYNVNFEWSNQPLKQVETHCQMNVSTSPVFKMGKFIIHQYGKDFAVELSKSIYQAKRQKIQMIEAFINLNKEGAEESANELLKQGFTFVGIIPANHHGNFAIFQLLNGIIHNIEKMKLIPEGVFFKNYLQTQYKTQIQ